jgi:hypothetical protein
MEATMGVAVDEQLAVVPLHDPGDRCVVAGPGRCDHRIVPLAGVCVDARNATTGPAPPWTAIESIERCHWTPPSVGVTMRAPDPGYQRFAVQRPRVESGGSHMSVAGTWNLSIATPIGKQEVVLELVDDDGVLAGTATGAGETVDLVDPALDGDRLTWTQSITKPVQLDLAFDVTIDGESLEGTAKAGILPKSKVSGTRVQ